MFIFLLDIFTVLHFSDLLSESPYWSRMNENNRKLAARGKQGFYYTLIDQNPSHFAINHEFYNDNGIFSYVFSQLALK